MSEALSKQDKIKVGISSCLLGEQVRFDGGHKRNAYITSFLSVYFDFVAFCPEVSIGLGIPRKTLRLENNGKQIICVESKDSSQEFTINLEQCAQEQFNWHEQLCGYILKRSSPSCGMERVKVFSKGQPSNTGVGIYAKRLMENFPNLPVEEEGRLEDAVIRENFVQRVIVYHRWQAFLKGDINKHSFSEFHGRHKLILMSHDQDLTRALGADLAKVASKDLKDFVPFYIDRLMALLKIKATVKNHVNVLQHIQGYLKRDLSKEDKAELSEVITDYRLGQLPLIVPITLLKHHFRSHPNEYIASSYYMQPHPKELMLLNSI